MSTRPERGTKVWNQGWNQGYLAGLLDAQRMANEASNEAHQAGRLEVSNAIASLSSAILHERLTIEGEVWAALTGKVRVRRG